MKNTNASGCENALGKSAFTLAELLMAVLVISIIMVALAPVITKRVHENMNVEVTKVKGEEIYANPGMYTFEVPAGITTLFIQGAGGSGGGSGAAVSDWHTDNYNYTNIPSGSMDWKVPKGVNQIELTITGSGGGGGAGYVKDNAQVYNSSSIGTPPRLPDGSRVNRSDVTLYSNSCLSDEFLATRASEEGYDLCITKENINFTNWLRYLNTTVDQEAPKSILQTTSTTEAQYCFESQGNCFWPKGSTADGSIHASSVCYNNTGYSSCNRPLATLRTAKTLCSAYHASVNDYYQSDLGEVSKSAGYRLMSLEEGRILGKYGKTWGGGSGLRLCGPPSSGFESCVNFGTCPGSPLKNCRLDYVALNGGVFFPGYQSDGNGYGYSVILKNEYSFLEAITVRCARPLYRSVNYNGAGGNAGAKYTKTINVLPGDTIKIVLGSGGAGGQIGVNSGNGSKGNRTTVTHKRGSTTMGTYYVEGANGGKGATSSAHGVSAGSASQSCYESYRTTISGTLTSRYPSCYESYGEKGTDNAGGKGGSRLADYKAQGGMLYNDDLRTANQTNTTVEATCSNGESATPYSPSSTSLFCSARDNKYATYDYRSEDTERQDVAGAGGGGGYAPPWVAKYSTSQRKNYAKGGQGGSGNVSLKYRVIVPGAGGGSGARLGGAKFEGQYIDHEIAYRVKEGDKIKITVGNKGYGGDIGQDGTDGDASYISSNSSTITFNAGRGARATTNLDAITGCLTAASNGHGGSSYPSDVVERSGCYYPSVPGASSTGISFPSSSYYKLLNITMPADKFRGTPGKVSPQTNSADAPWQYRLDGGMGGLGFAGTFQPPEMSAARACGGGISATVGDFADYTNATYSCLSGNPDGRSGVNAIAAAENGGRYKTISGGGGGGAIENSPTIGKGGDGSTGYIKIRWEQAENIDW